jgi:hypothetical protein
MSRTIAERRIENEDDLRDENGQLEIVSSNEAYTALVRGEVDIQIATAKRYPRSISKFKDSIREMACLDRETAQSCTYALPRAGKSIIGPSVRFAEICATAWKNLRIAARVIGMDERQMTCQGVAHDLETNVAISVDIKRRITDKEGRRFNDDMLTVTGNAANAIALRNAILKVVPKAYWNPVWLESREVARGEGLTLAEQQKEAFDFFAKTHKVPAAKILARLEKRAIEDVDIDDIDILLGIKTALEEGATTIAQAFEPPVAGEAPPKRAYLAQHDARDALPRREATDAAKAPLEREGAQVIERNRKLKVETDGAMRSERVPEAAKGDEDMEAMERELEQPADPSGQTREELFDVWNEVRNRLKGDELVQVRKKIGGQFVNAQATPQLLRQAIAAAEAILAAGRK